MAMIYEERALDSVFSQFILRLRGSEEKPPFPLRIAVSMAARAAASGDVCFDLASLQGTVVEHEGLRVTMPSLNTFRALFFDSGVASAPARLLHLFSMTKVGSIFTDTGNLSISLPCSFWRLPRILLKTPSAVSFRLNPGGGRKKLSDMR